MAEWFATGRIVDAILVLVAAEAAMLLAFRWRTGRGPAPVPLLCNLVSGAALMLAVRAALVQSPWPVVAGWMLVSLGAHLGDLVPRLRNPAGLTLRRTSLPGVPGTSDAAAAFNARPRS
ncbi:hypothetical protein MKK55_03300 [Methylobacterium sp. J-059]|uniref:hypothetical protein n=1 Tax=Methylobacterium sp. J-059 TaxID=2836643 RepID=UPI001FBA77DC|nr:hypothetical protein [Methylobacterium sp. J-059]MCJ2037985.1 hypothetical protein [Methylobacterium sp. J-059]